MSSIIEVIKAKIDLVEEIGLVVALQKSGKSFKGACPFHNERTPSFYVFPETQTWRCFGCNEGGDVFTFVEKQQGLDFWEALRYLADKAGESVEEQGGRNPEEDRELRARKERLRQMNEDALLWFHQMLLRSQEASQARVYLQQRGISAETVITFSLGYAPDRWDGVSHYLLDRGYTERELVSGGLARERETGPGVYDYFRSRIMFPIRNGRGQVIGFGGRILGEGQPKYLNSPQTLLFEKNTVLYAMDRAREAIKQAKQVIIVEGYVDAIMAHQHGTLQTVACIGSAITEKHIQQLKKLTRQVTLALDPDAAGMAATEHGIQEALKAFDRTVVPVPMAAERRPGEPGKRRQEPRGIIRLEERVDAEINVLRLPAGEDPDEVILRKPEVWDEAVAHPLPLIDYYFEAKTMDLDLREAAAKAVAAERLLPVIGMLTDRARRDVYVRKLASMLRVDERSLNGELQRILHSGSANGTIARFSDRGELRAGREKSPGWGNQQDEEVHKEPARNEVQERSGLLDRLGQNKIKWEDYLLGLLLRNPELSSHVCGIINDGDFAGTDTRELYRIFSTVYQRGSSPLHQSIEAAVPSALLVTVERARKSVESGASIEGPGLVKMAVQCATRLRRARLQQTNTEVQYLLREAEATGDVGEVQQFRRQLVTIHQQLRTIDSAMHLQG